MEVATRVPLTRERIIEAAVAFVDVNGLDALSMRKLGAALGVEAMSLYNHVDNKDDVLDGILDHVLREVPLPDPDQPWAEQLRILARGFRDAGLAHPGVLPMFGSRRIRTVEAFAPLERAYDILREAGLDADAALDAFLAMASFVLGRILLEMGSLQVVPTEGTVDLSAIPTDQHPRLVELKRAVVSSSSAREFERGLDLLLAGIGSLFDPVAD
jgi:TetR/AcrR family transcriptional regulator, tetracycline repressor protein